ncbi:hypothetical protein GCM10009578_091380 [Streptomyces rhizosphaericus]
MILARVRAFPVTVATRYGRAGKTVPVSRTRHTKINYRCVCRVEPCTFDIGWITLENATDLRR